MLLYGDKSLAATRQCQPTSTMWKVHDIDRMRWDRWDTITTTTNTTETSDGPLPFPGSGYGFDLGFGLGLDVAQHTKSAYLFQVLSIFLTSHRTALRTYIHLLQFPTLLGLPASNLARSSAVFAFFLKLQ